MKKILVLSILFVIGCTPQDRFEKLTPPIVLIAKSNEGSVTVCDKNNKYVTLPRQYYIAKTIHYSYEIGDTVLFFEPVKD